MVYNDKIKDKFFMERASFVSKTIFLWGVCVRDILKRIAPFL